MKTRNGLVSNSSSCSFTFLTKDLTENQINQIINYRTEAPKFGLESFSDWPGWHIDKLEHALEISTHMDGFDILEYIEDYLKINISGRIKKFYHSNH